MAQQLLPELPIPSLSSTQPKLIEWIRPLVDGKQFEQTLSVIDSFFTENGDAEKLQKKLQQWNKNQDGSWYTPFWNDLYLKHRAPLPLTMNFNALLNEEQNIKQNTVFKTAGEIGFLAAEFYHGIIDAQSGKISDSSQSNKLFRSVRIPQTKRDAFHTADLDKRTITLFFYTKIMSIKFRLAMNKARYITASISQQPLKQL